MSGARVPHAANRTTRKTHLWRSRAAMMGPAGPNTIGAAAPAGQAGPISMKGAAG